MRQFRWCKKAARQRAVLARKVSQTISGNTVFAEKYDTLLYYTSVQADGEGFEPPVD